MVITPAERVPMSPADRVLADRLCDLLQYLLCDRPLWQSVAILEALTKIQGEPSEAAAEPSVQ